MSSLRSLLHDADPLRHEAPHLDRERERIRLAILRVRPDGSARPARSPAMLLVLAIAVIGMMLGYQIWQRGITPVMAAVRFEVRLAEAQPIPGLTVAQFVDSSDLIYLHPEIVVSNDDIARSWVVQDGAGQFGVSVELLPSGAGRMRQATASHVGRPVAILIDGKVVTAPVVRSPISDSAVINGNYTRAEAERIVEGIGRR